MLPIDLTDSRAGASPAPTPESRVRRLFLATALAATTLLTALPVAADWAQFRREPSQHGVADSNLPENLQPVWIHRLPDGAETTPAIADGTVYIGGLSGRFVALDLETGEQKWSIETGEEIKSSALVKDGVVYFGDEFGKLRALDAATGAEKWMFEAESSISASPNWASYADGACLVVGSYDNSIYCLDPATGQANFKIETEGHVHGSPAVADGLIYSSGCDGFLRGVDAKTGAETFKLQIGSYVAASPAVLGSRLVVGTFDNEVVSVDLGKREVDWRYKHPEREFPFYSSPAVTSDIVVLGGRDKMIHAIDVKTGEPRWIHTMRTRIDASPVIVGDRVIVADQRGKLEILNLADGKPLWEFTADDAFIGSPAISGGKLVIAAGDGAVYAFGEKKPKKAGGPAL